MKFSASFKYLSGVNPGVIVGVLIAGIAAVILIAIVYAKYRQHKKKKDGRNFKVQTGKLSNARQVKFLLGNSIAINSL